MSKKKCFWRLVEKDQSVLGVDEVRWSVELVERSGDKWYCHRQVASRFTAIMEPCIAVFLNSLLANKKRFPGGELDYSALSPKTCEALRELGVEIPEGVTK